MSIDWWHRNAYGNGKRAFGAYIVDDTGYDYGYSYGLGCDGDCDYDYDFGDDVDGDGN